MRINEKQQLTKELLSYVFSIKSSDLGLFSGLSGLLLFLKSNRTSIYESKIENISSVVRRRLLGVNNYSICNGYAGILMASPYDNESQVMKQSSLAAIYKLLQRGSILNNFNFDYLHGKLGIINSLLYFDSSNTTLQDDIHNNILKIDLFKSFEKYFNCSGLINFGLAHGIPGYINLLINIHKCYPQIHNEYLIEENLNFILEFRNKSANKAHWLYPSWINTMNQPIHFPSRLAWCYGDLGVCFTILKATDYLKLNNLTELVISDLIQAAFRLNKKSLVINDYSLCHGLSGIIFAYKLLYLYYSIPEFKITSEYLENVLIRTYTKYGIVAILKGRQMENYGLLDGPIGILIALMFEDIDVEVIAYILLMDIKK